MFKIVNEYRIHRFAPLIYLFLVTFLLSLVQFIIFLPEPKEHEIPKQLFQLSTVLLSMSFILLLTLLFFDSFDHESVLSRRNVTLMTLVTTLGFLIMTTIVFIVSIIAEDPDKFDLSEEGNLSNSEAWINLLLN